MSKPNFVDISELIIDCWVLTTSGFEKQTSAILEFYFRFWSRLICMSFCITLPNFVQIGAPTAEIWRHFHFPRWRPRPQNTSSGFVLVDNKRPPYWKCTFGIDFNHLLKIRTLCCIRLPNFVQIEAPTSEIWRYIYFSRWRPRPLNTTSGFALVDVTALRRSK